VPSVSPSGGGGGGVSAPLTLTAPNDLNPILTLVEAAGTIADGNAIYVIRDENGANHLYLDPDFLILKAGVGAGPQEVDIQQSDAGGGSIVLHTQAGLTVNKGGVRLQTAGATNSGLGFVADGPHAAPAAGALASGEWTLWFDQTNGASKLMVKAKSADGTVVTAAVALA
jgi:hypothetical protein